MGHAGKNQQKQGSWWCATCRGQDDWTAPNPKDAGVFNAHAPPQGTCENLRNTWKTLTNQNGKECSVVDTIYEGILEESKRKMTGEQGRFMQAKNKEAVKIGELELYKEAMKVTKPLFDVETYPSARIKE